MITGEGSGGAKPILRNSIIAEYDGTLSSYYAYGNVVPGEDVELEGRNIVDGTLFVGNQPTFFRFEAEDFLRETDLFNQGLLDDPAARLPVVLPRLDPSIPDLLKAANVAGLTLVPRDVADLDRDGNTDEAMPFDITGAPRVQGDLDIGAVELPSRLVVTTRADTIADDGQLSLREAVLAAEASPGPDLIDFDPGLLARGGKVFLSQGQLEITSAVTIRGDIEISAIGADRAFDVMGGTLRLEEVSLTNGRADEGGAIRVTDGRLELADVTLEGNRATTGAGIFADGSEVQIRRSTFTSNVAEEVGGGAYLSGGTARLENVTFFGNRAETGGALASPSGEVAIYNATVTANTATASGGGLSVGGATMLTNSIVAGNKAPTERDISGIVIRREVNIIGDSLSGAGASPAVDLEEIFEVDGDGTPVLANNGGLVETVAIREAGPATDANENFPNGIVRDARGEGREFRASDIGALELQEELPEVTGLTRIFISEDETETLNRPLRITDQGIPLLIEDPGVPQDVDVGTLTPTQFGFSFTLDGDAVADLEGGEFISADYLLTTTDGTEVTIEILVLGVGDGDGLDNTLTGSLLEDTIEGLGGNDILSGLGRDDLLDGGEGDDWLLAGTGADTFIGG
ncbi:MAG: choice-of-anchor Q domain-containing protein, partial [Pseudomonadota bacterium]